ncbi:MAG: hypothetical protein ACM30E_02615, partial [Nitrososphaerales archaeon]
QRVTFLLFGAGDGTARFWTAMLAGLTPLLFYFVRGQLTREGALAAAFLWTLSPLGVWSSRLAIGNALVPTFSLALLAVVAWPRRGRGWAAVLGLMAGLLLISGSEAYTVVLAALLGLAWFAPEARALWSSVRREGRYALIGIGVALLIACFFLAEPVGLAAAAGLPGRWLSGLVPGAGEYSAAEILWRLLLSELLVVGFGIVGLVWSVRRSDRFGTWVAASTALALLAALIGSGRQPVDLALVALGLTLLAGPAVARALAQAYEWRRDRDGRLLLLVSMALLIAAATAIPSGLNPTNTADWRSLYLGVGIASFIMVIIVWVTYGVWESWRVIGAVVPLVLLLFSLAWQVGQMVSLAYERGAWRQPAILHELPATDLVDLQKLLINFGSLTGGGRDATVDVAWPDLVTDPVVPVLRWQLRDFEAANFSASIPPEPARIVITPAEQQDKFDGYSGEGFGVLQRWTTGNLGDFSSALRWVLYREALTQPEKTRAIFWVKW